MRHAGLLAAVLALAWQPARADVPADVGREEVANLAQQRRGLLDGIDGWKGLSDAHAYADLSQRLLSLRASAAALALGPGASDALRALRLELETVQQEFLARKFGASASGGSGEAPAAQRQRRRELAQAQADALREVGRRPFIAGAHLEALRKLVLHAGSSEELNRFFENDASLLGAPLGQKVAESLSGLEPAVEPASARDRSAWPVPSSRLGTLRTAEVPPPPNVSPDRGGGARPPGGTAPAPRLDSKRAKLEWQRQMLVRTGAWEHLALRGVDPEAFIEQLTGAESDYRTSATSPKGASGVMQVMPETARGIMLSDPLYAKLARLMRLTVYDAARMSAPELQRMLNEDPATCILIGTLYIAADARSFGKIVDDLRVSLDHKAKLMINLMAGAYNAGPGRVRTALRRLVRSGRDLEDVDPSKSIVSWIPETVRYTSRILRGYVSSAMARSGPSLPAAASSAP
ncbi:MAG: transglycosylase SLT domain-containing protein [Elusimicrobia bacterium]|nr:transglycosylase SLT domain-containing protein [Elusimicrobiota bacterium]